MVTISCLSICRCSSSLRSADSAASSGGECRFPSEQPRAKIEAGSPFGVRHGDASSELRAVCEATALSRRADRAPGERGSRQLTDASPQREYQETLDASPWTTPAAQSAVHIRVMA